MTRIDALEASQRALRGELERVAYERDGLKGEVMQLRTELQIIQDMAGRMRVHFARAFGCCGFDRRRTNASR